MGFFDFKVACAVCEKEVGLNRFPIANKQHICPNCFKEAGFNNLATVVKPIKQMTPEDVVAAKQNKKLNDDEIVSFNPTKKIGNFVEFDDDQKKWIILTGMFGKRDKSTVYNYSDIVDFELLEDGESVSQGGLGRALVGGALLGGVGAVVGGVTGKRKNKSVCNSLKIKITLNNINNPVTYIKFLETATKKDSFVYKNIYTNAQECLSVLQLICDNQSGSVSNAPVASNSTSAADEILKFKNLLDQGIITQEEFDVKKKELLGV